MVLFEYVSNKCLLPAMLSSAFSAGEAASPRWAFSMAMWAPLRRNFI